MRSSSSRSLKPPSERETVLEDDYEGRFWTGLHRHVALVMMAHSFLSIRRNHGLPPQTDSTDGPRQFPSATSVAGFPP